MAATAGQIGQLRRMAGVGAGDTTYTDQVLGEYIERYPLPDAAGHTPGDEAWVSTWDLHAAAADVLEERAVALATEFDFSADGAGYQRSQAYEALMKQVRHHRARRTPATATLVKWPPEREMDLPWIANLPEAE